MQKAKVYALEGSNIEKIHSDEDIALRVKAASTEKAWEGAGKAEGLEVWRVREFKLEKLDDKDEGTFYAGDSYVVLRTRKIEDHLDWNIHFWLGQETSIDEAGVAAYKTVELDDLLGGKPVEYREVQGHESDLFLSYFKPSIKILQGGYASGFRHVTPEKYTPRLLHVSGNARRVNVVEVPLKASSLNNDDVFILDCGLKIYQWIGPGAGPFEKSKAAETCARIDAERKGQPVVVVLDGKVDESEFWKHLGGKQAVQNKLKEEVKQYQNALFRLSDASGQLKFEKVASGKLGRNMLDSNDSFIVDAGNIVYVWIGAKCSKQEKKMAFPQAQTYLTKEGRPYYTTVTVVKEGNESPEFKALF